MMLNHRFNNDKIVFAAAVAYLVHIAVNGLGFEDPEQLPIDPEIHQRRLDCQLSPGLLKIVKFSISFKVVNCFLGIIMFQLVSEVCLGYLEEAVHGTVYAAVLHKT